MLAARPVRDVHDLIHLLDQLGDRDGAPVVVFVVVVVVVPALELLGLSSSLGLGPDLSSALGLGLGLGLVIDLGLGLELQWTRCAADTVARNPGVRGRRSAGWWWPGSAAAVGGRSEGEGRGVVEELVCRYPGVTADVLDLHTQRSASLTGTVVRGGGRGQEEGILREAVVWWTYRAAAASISELEDSSLAVVLALVSRRGVST